MPSPGGALQDRSRLVVPARLPARPVLQASTAQLRVYLPALIALPALSQRDLFRPLLVLRVLLGFTAPRLASRHANPAPWAKNARRLDYRWPLPVLQDFFRIKRVKARACLVMQAHSAAALV